MSTTPLQSRFRLPWRAFQYLLAGYFDRGRHIRAHYTGQRRVLEIGCSLGHDSHHFAGVDCDFLGIDIDAAAVATAARSHAGRPHMRYACRDVHDLPASEPFDLIYLVGVCHHVPDAPLVSLLTKAGELLAPDGRLALIDYAPAERPGLLERFFLRYDEGRYIRSREALLALLRSVPTLAIERQEIFANAVFLGSWPVMAHKFSIAMTRRAGAGDVS